MEEPEHVSTQSETVDPFDKSQTGRSLLVLVLLMYLVGIALWNPGIRFFPLPIVNLILIGAAAVFWRPKAYPALLLPFLGLGAALAITTLTSPLPILEGLFYWMLVALAYWVASEQHPALLELALWLYFIAIGISGLLETLYLSVLGGALIRPGSLMGNPNELGFVLIIALAIGTKRLLGARGKAALGAYASLCLFALLLLFTGSRASWLGAAVGVIVIFALEPSVRKQLLRPMPLVGLGIAALVMSPVVINQVFHSDHGLPAQRLDMWRGALEAFAARPLVGYGPWTFGVVYQPRVEHPWLMFHSHNLVLNLAAETGVVGLSALGWLLVTAWQSGKRRALPVAYMAAILTASMLDYTFWIPGAGLCALVGWQVLAPDQKPYLSWWKVGAVILAVGTALALAFRI